MVHPFISSKLPELRVIFSLHKVKSAYLFGSVCTELFNENSDVDFLIEPGEELDPVIKGENLWNLYYALKKSLNRDIDLVTRESLKNKYFIEEVKRTSVSIYG
jgi:predicted nucleotidyltransferase